MNDHTQYLPKTKKVCRSWPRLGLIVARVVSCNSPALAFRTCLPPYSDVLPDLLPWLPSFSAAFAFLLAATSVDSASNTMRRTRRTSFIRCDTVRRTPLAHRKEQSKGKATQSTPAGPSLRERQSGICRGTGGGWNRRSQPRYERGRTQPACVHQVCIYRCAHA